MKSTTCKTLLAALPLALAACSTTGPGGDVPAAIAVPSGNAFAFTLKASGLQTYECRAKTGAAGGYDWDLVGPEAALRDKNDALVGRHFAGPIWEVGDGSAVSGKILAVTPAPVPGNLPWVLLRGAPTGTGMLGGVTYIQRLHTSGGTAPSDTCGAAQAGTKKSVHYTADYVFYKA